MRNAIAIILFFSAPAFGSNGYLFGGTPVASVGGGSNTDTFVDANGTALATHNANWVDTGGSNGNVAYCQIQSNTLQATSGFAGCIAMYNTSVSDASSLIVPANSDSSTSKQPCVRAGNGAGSDRTGYCAQLETISGSNWTDVHGAKNGGFFDDKTVSVLVASDHTLKITASGTSTVTITYYVDGVNVGTSSDSSSPLAASHPGFKVQDNGTASFTNTGTWTDAP